MSNIYGQTLLDEMVRDQGLPVALVKAAASEILTIIREGLIQDGIVTVSHFGTFRLKTVAERKGINPRTREPLIIPAHQRVLFTPCKALRELIKEPVVASPASDSKTALRSAARSAPIAPTEFTKRLTDTVPVKNDTHRSSTEVAAEDGVAVEESPATATPPPRATADGVKEGIETSASPPASVEETIASTETEVAEDTTKTIQLDLAPAQERRNRHHLLGAAALLVLAVVGLAYLMRSDRETPPTTISSAQGTSAGVVEARQATKEPTAQTTGETTSEPAKEEAITQTTAQPPSRDDAIAEAQPVAASEPTIPQQQAEPKHEEASAQSTALPAASDNAATGSTNAAPAQENDTPVEAPASTTPISTAEQTSNSTTNQAGVFFQETTHMVANGSSLWRLARQHYQNPLLWPLIFQANANLIDNPDLLPQGATITLPTLHGTPGHLTTDDRRNIAEGYYLTYLHYERIGHKDAFFALLEAKRYDSSVVEKYREQLKLSKLQQTMLERQQTMPF